MVAMTTGPLNQFRKDVLHLPPPKTPYMGSAPCLAMFSEYISRSLSLSLSECTTVLINRVNE